MWKLAGLLGSFIQFVIGLFSKDSDDHLEEAYDKVKDQDETIAGLEEESNYKDLEAVLDKAKQEIKKPGLAQKLKNYYNNRGEKK